MAGKTYRVGIIGAGAIAQACHAPGYARDQRTTLVAFADPVAARHNEMTQLWPEVRGYKDYVTMLGEEKLDIVSVCSPNQFHARHTIDALRARCHVLCEKPMAVKLNEADAMKEAAKAARRKLMVGYTQRMVAGPMQTKALLQKKALGKPFMIRVRFAHGGPYPGWAKSDWFYDPEIAAGGAMLDMGIHAIDLCLWLMGPIVSVQARAATIMKRIEVDDNAVLLLEFESGALGYIEVGWTSKPGFTGFEIYGAKGSLICDYINGLQRCGGKQSAGQDSHSEWTMVDPEPMRGGWDAEIARWLDVVQGKEKLTMDADAGRAALAVALAAYKSSRSGKRIAL